MIRSRAGVFVVLVAAGLCLAAVPQASAATGSISGTVTQYGGATPIEGIEACVESQEETGPEEWFFACGLTSENGGYSVSNIPAGSYIVEFWPNGLNYVRQFYPEKAHYEEAIPVTVGSGEKGGIDAALKGGGVLSGRITDAFSGDGLGGIEVCAFTTDGSFNGGCAYSEKTGDYSIKGLPSGSYLVEVWPESGGYQVAMYGGGSGTPVEVTVGATASGIDVKLERGATISGRVTDAGGAGIGKVFACLHDAASGDIRGCVRTASNGTYTIEGIENGSFKVGFSEEFEPGAGDGYDTQFYDGKATFAEATVITLVAPEVRAGIDGRLGRPGTPAPVVFPIGIVKPPIGLPVRRRSACKKGFVKKKVRGKSRCVKKHKKHHSKAHR